MCISNLFKQPKPPKLAPPPSVPTFPVDEGQADFAASEARETAKRRSAARSTLLTSPFGVTEEADVGRKTLLGA